MKVKIDAETVDEIIGYVGAIGLLALLLWAPTLNDWVSEMVQSMQHAIDVLARGRP